VSGLVPPGPVDFDEVVRRFPAVRQSLLSSFDDCELSTLFSIRYERGWSTHPQAAGTIFHRFAAACLREMREYDSESIPVGAALQILEDTLRQADVPPEDIVRVPLRDMPLLEMVARKFAADNAFSVRSIIDIEKRLEATLRYPDPETGEMRERVLSGQLDALIARPPDEAVVIDWKHTWALPPKRDEDADEPGVSYHGFFQQWFYAWLVMKNYSAVNACSLREFYPRRTQARTARVVRADLDRIERRLGILVGQFDRAVAAGEPPSLRMGALERHGSWKPSPGKHCDWCAKSHLCPIDDDYKGDGGVRTMDDAMRLAAVRHQAKAVYDAVGARLKVWTETNGPVPIKWSKGRRVLGHRPIANGKTRFEEWTPEGADRPASQLPETDVTEGLRDAMREATARAREERDRQAAE
jgi:hypothetical protein